MRYLLALLTAGAVWIFSMLNVLADDAKDVEAAILQFAEAYRSGDVAAVDQLIAEDYSHINNGGEPIDRTDYMAWNNLRAGHLKKGEWRIDQYEVTELVITTHELSAVATGRVIAKGERNGKQWNSDVRFTNLWIKESGHWRRAGFHDTALDKVE